MIEAKDKEQAVFELMRTFKLPGFDTFNDIIPNFRDDDNKPLPTPKKKAPRKKSKNLQDEDEQSEVTDGPVEAERRVILADEVGMGGPDGRVYWPPGMEEWLRPVKRVIKPKEPKAATPKATPAKKGKAAAEAADTAKKLEEELDKDVAESISTKGPQAQTTKVTPKKGSKKVATSKKADAVPTPSTSEDMGSEALSDLSSQEEQPARTKKVKTPAQGKGRSAPARKSSGRAKKISYTEED